VIIIINDLLTVGNKFFTICWVNKSYFSSRKEHKIIRTEQIVLRRFRSRCGLYKVLAVVVYKRSRCRHISVLIACIFVISKSLKNSKRTRPYGLSFSTLEKSVPFNHFLGYSKKNSQNPYPIYDQNLRYGLPCL